MNSNKKESRVNKLSGPDLVSVLPSVADAKPSSGYYFKILTRQGAATWDGAKDYIVNGHMTLGYAIVAYPAEYGVSGIKTFLVNQRGVVYEKDLGTTTGALAAQMMRFNPDKTWQAVQGE